MKDSVIVGFHSTTQSTGALRWAIEHCRISSSKLLVIHASQIPIAVQNGPSASIAHQLGNPLWANVFSIVNGFDAARGSTTIVRSGDIVDLIRAEAEDAKLVVLGPRRRRILTRVNTQRRLQAVVDCPVIRIDGRESWPAPHELVADLPDLVDARC